MHYIRAQLCLQLGHCNEPEIKNACPPDVWTQWGKERVAQTERVALTYVQCVCVCVCVCACACSVMCGLCNPVDCSPPGSSVCGILQARILEWVAIPFSRGSSPPRDRTWVSCIAGRLPTEPPGRSDICTVAAAAAAAKSLQSCPTLCDPIDGSPPGSAISGILQARTPEWVVIPFSNACK